MFRISTHSLMIVIYVAAQLAAMPHGHGANENQPLDHDARPHVHVGWSEHDHQPHEHEHPHGQHHEPDVSQLQEGLSTADDEGDDHDRDAVYLPDDVGKSLVAGKSTCSLEFLEVNSVVVELVPNHSSLSVTKFGNLHFDECCCSSPALYLVLRALRI